MKPLDMDVLGIGAWAVGREGWPALARALQGLDIEPSSGKGATRPSPSLLPPAERRRAPDGVAVALEVAREAVHMAQIDPTTLASVFTSAHGDLAIVDYLCETLATDPTSLSPTRFHLSVHNAAGGYWSIATHDSAPTTALAGGDDSFALGLLEAATLAIAEQRPVLLVAFDTQAVGLLAQATHSTALFGFALVLQAAREGDEPGTLSLTIDRGTMPSRPLRREALRALASSSAAARGLILAEALARDDETTLHLSLGPASLLSVHVRPRIEPL
jgi:hypothetical protein